MLTISSKNNLYGFYNRLMKEDVSISLLSSSPERISKISPNKRKLTDDVSSQPVKKRKLSDNEVEEIVSSEDEGWCPSPPSSADLDMLPTPVNVKIENSNLVSTPKNNSSSLFSPNLLAQLSSKMKKTVSPQKSTPSHSRYNCITTSPTKSKHFNVNSLFTFYINQISF